MGGSGLQRNAYQVGKIHQSAAQFAQIYDAMVLKHVARGTPSGFEK
jgi:hypothetical protein